MPYARTKIVATLGPASAPEKRLKALIEAGANVFRLNFSHGTHEDHRQLLERVRKVEADLGTPVAVLQDLCGPKIRATELEAMFRPSMAPCRSGGEARLIMAEILGMARDMPQAPTAMTRGMTQPWTRGIDRPPSSSRVAGNQATGASTCSTSDAPNSSIPVASTRASPNRRARRPAKKPWFSVDITPTIMKLSPTSRAPQA